ncbi:hypothetical protein AKJ16_DCAP04040 [Drosera capensis]
MEYVFSWKRVRHESSKYHFLNPKPLTTTFNGIDLRRSLVLLPIRIPFHLQLRGARTPIFSPMHHRSVTSPMTAPDQLWLAAAELKFAFLILEYDYVEESHPLESQAPLIKGPKGPMCFVNHDQDCSRFKEPMRPSCISHGQKET